MSTLPPITVITVVRNAVKTIEECIQSVLQQQIDNLEYIVIDGASMDGTLEIIEKHRKFITRIVSEPDGGLYDAMNKGLRSATGVFIHFLNADDRYVSSDVLRSLMPDLQTGVVCYGQMVYVEGFNRHRLLGAPFSLEAELRESRIPQPALFVPRKLYREVGEFDLSLKVAADYDMILRLTSRFPVKYIPKPLIVMRAGGVSYQRTDLAFWESMIVSRRYGRSFVGSWLTYLRRIIKWRIARALPLRLLVILQCIARR